MTDLLGGKSAAQLHRYAQPFLVTLVVGLVAAGLIATGLRYIAAIDDFDERKLYAEDATQLAYLELAETLVEFTSDLRVLAKNPNLARLSDPDSDFRRAAERALLAFAEEKSLISQVRFIDTSGQEIVRIDRHGPLAAAVPPSDLQNKSGRYYFQAAIGLPIDGLYVSALDLNIEHGKVQEPWQPTLRLAEPVAGMDGAPIGILILNILAEDYANSVNSKRPGASQPVQLLNADGYWLAGTTSDKLWGFLLDHGSTMARENIAAWREISRRQNGSVVLDDIYYVFRTLNPVTVLSDLPNVSAVQSDDPFWVILATAEAPTVPGLWSPQDLPLVFAAVALIALLSMAVAWLWRARKEAEADKRAVEAELVRVERMASLGNLVAGIAHELNTPIGNAVTVASTLTDRVNALQQMISSGQLRRSALEACLKDLVEGTDIMQRGLGHAAELIRNFKQIAVDQTTEQRRRFQLSEIVGEVAGMMGPRFKHGLVTLETEVTGDVEMDSYPGPLAQVLMNLSENSLVHGFDDGQSGRIIISARRTEGDEVEIAVIDTGKGIAPEDLNRVFEPFFTTRLGSGGTGLGLSICFQIVTQTLGGTIGVTSQPGEGTRMTLELPLAAPGRKSLQE